MHVVIKRSGNIGASPEAARKAAQEVADVRDYLGDKGGLTLMPGGGAGGRGREFMAAGMDPIYADTLGRLATLQNGIILSDQLERAGVRTRLLTAPTVRYSDTNGIGDLGVCTPESLQECHEDYVVPIVVFGTGKNNQSTDTASIEIADDYQRAFGIESRVMKAMEHNGVFAEDPARNPNAHRFSIISAEIVAADPALAAVVDPRCLGAIMNTGIEMQLFDNNTHTMLEALQQPERIGTIITPLGGIMEPPIRL